MNSTKILIGVIVLAVAIYFFDARTAKRGQYDALVVKMETDRRCQSNHESMCKYWVLVKVEELNNIEKYFQIPQAYYHQKMLVPEEDTLQVIVKEKKILGPRILALGPDSKEAMAEYPFE